MAVMVLAGGAGLTLTCLGDTCVSGVSSLDDDGRTRFFGFFNLDNVCVEKQYR